MLLEKQHGQTLDARLPQNLHSVKKKKKTVSAQSNKAEHNKISMPKRKTYAFNVTKNERKNKFQITFK